MLRSLWRSCPTHAEHIPLPIYQMLVTCTQGRARRAAGGCPALLRPRGRQRAAPHQPAPQVWPSLARHALSCIGWNWWLDSGAAACYRLRGVSIELVSYKRCMGLRQGRWAGPPPTPRAHAHAMLSPPCPDQHQPPSSPLAFLLSRAQGDGRGPRPLARRAPWPGAGRLHPGLRAPAPHAPRHGARPAARAARAAGRAGQAVQRAAAVQPGMGAGAAAGGGARVHVPARVCVCMYVCVYVCMCACAIGHFGPSVLSVCTRGWWDTLFSTTVVLWGSRPRAAAPSAPLTAGAAQA